MKRTNVYKKSYMYICNWTIGYPDVHNPIAAVNIKKNKLTFVEPNFHYIINRTLTDLEEILYQGQ